MFAVHPISTLAERRCPKMLIGLEGAHVFYVSTFGRVEHLRNRSFDCPRALSTFNSFYELLMRVTCAFIGSATLPLTSVDSARTSSTWARSSPNCLRQ